MHFFLFGVDSIQKKRGKCATTKYSLACKFLCFFLFEIYLPIFNYFLIYIYKKNSCILLSFLVQINKSFFWNLYIFRFYVRFYYICAEMHWNSTLKHLILITFVFKTSFNDYFDVMLIFICHWHKIDFFPWILFSLQNNPIKWQIIDKELKIYCCHTVHFPFEIQKFSVHVLTQQLYNISHYCNDVYNIHSPLNKTKVWIDQ